MSKQISSQHPMHILLLADDSESMAGEPADLATEAIQAWILELQLQCRGKKPWFRFSLVTFGSSAEAIARCLNVNDIDASGFALDGSSGTTDLAAALSVARELIESDGATDAHCPPFVFLFTDGRADDEVAALREAAWLKRMDLPCGAPRIVTLGFGGVDHAFLSQLATTHEFHKSLATPHDLVRLLPKMGTPTKRGRGNGTVDELEAQIAGPIMDI
jgi:uncharacterized protein YegL